MLKRSIEILLAAALVILSPLSAFAQSERPAVVRANVYVDRGFVVGDLSSRHLFSEQIVGTVESGLPAVVELLYRFVNRDNKTVDGGVRFYELGYDVWEDRYSIAGADSTAYYVSFPQMGGAVEQLRGIKLLPVASLQDDAEYALHFKVAVHPLRSRDRNDMVEWMGENMMGQGDSEKRQMLNLNDLIKHFFSREKSGDNQSPWFETPYFQPARLRARGEGASR